MKKFLYGLVGLWFLPSFALAQQNTVSPGEHITNFLVQIVIQDDSVIHVRERIAYDFGTAQKHGIYRDIPYEYQARGGFYTLRFSDISVTNESGTLYPFTTSKESDNFRIKIGDPNVLITGAHTYILDYTVKRALNFYTDHVELYWNAIGYGWQVPIVSSQVEVSLAGKTPGHAQVACFTGALGSHGQNCTFSLTTRNGAVVTTSKALQPGEGLTIVYGFEPELVSQPGLFEAIKDIVQDNGILGLPFAVFGLMYYIWRRFGKDPQGKSTVVPQFDLPKDMGPLELGVILDESIDRQDLASEIMYLAEQGYIRITKETSKILGLFNTTDYTLEKITNPPETLSFASKKMFDMVFHLGPVVHLSDFKGNSYFYNQLQDLKRDVFKNLTDRGYFVHNPVVVKGVWTGAGIFAGAVLTFSLGPFFGTYGVISGIASGIIILLFGLRMPVRTKLGVEKKAYAAGLKYYMNVAEKARLEFLNAPDKTPEHFQRFLPFAIALGVEKAWAEQFKDITMAQPAWYRDASGASFNAFLFSEGLRGFSNSFNATAPGGNSAASGGSGFGGGGFSGGGFGGGGGGSW